MSENSTNKSNKDEFSKINENDITEVENSQDDRDKDTPVNVKKQVKDDDYFWDEYYTLLNKIEKQQEGYIRNTEEQKSSLDNQETIYRIALNKPENNLYDNHHNDVSNTRLNSRKNMYDIDEDVKFKMDMKRYGFISFLLLLIFSIVILFYFIYENISVQHLIHENNPLVLNHLNDGEFVVVNSDDVAQSKILQGKEVKLNKVMSAMNYILKEGDNVIDVGSSYGYYSIYASKLISKNNTLYNSSPNEGYVFAFEGNSKVFEFFKDSIYLNNIKNILIYNISIFRINGSFYIDKLAFESKSKYIIISDHTEVPSEDQLQMNFYTLDSLMKNTEVRNIKLINVNSAGNEVDILLGARNIINSSSSIKILTTWNSTGKISEYRKFAKSMLNLGFKFWIVRENGNLLMVNYPEQMTYNDDNIILIARDLKGTEYEITEQQFKNQQ